MQKAYFRHSVPIGTPDQSGEASATRRMEYSESVFFGILTLAHQTGLVRHRRNARPKAQWSAMASSNNYLTWQSLDQSEEALDL
jgi:hypothetical protein